MQVSADSTILTPPSRKRGRVRRWTLRIAIALVVLVVCVELVARFRFGFGNPPLMQADPQIEYLFQPNQTVRRFGNLIHYNAYSMRADDFQPNKSSPDELRIFVIGDSIINGGALTDQSELATSILQRELSKQLGRKVIVGNASATSWGPPNQLAYMKRYPALLDADIVVIVTNSEDADDLPTFTPLVGVSPDMPDRKPLCAISELMSRYVLRWSGIMTHRVDQSPPPTLLAEITLENPKVQQSLADLRSMIEMAKSRKVPVVVAHYLLRAEGDGQPLPGYELVRQAARDAGAELIDIGPALIESKKAGQDPWRDVRHPNLVGQRIIADVLQPVLLAHLQGKRSAPSTNASGPLDSTQPRR